MIYLTILLVTMESLTSLDLSNFDTTNVTDKSDMFYDWIKDVPSV
jgi:surface protein